MDLTVYQAWMLFLAQPWCIIIAGPIALLIAFIIVASVLDSLFN